MPLRTAVLSAALLVPLAALTACGSGPGAQSGAPGAAVASLASSAPPGSPTEPPAAGAAEAAGAGTTPAAGAASGTPSPGSTADRPQQRLDDTQEHDAQLWTGYYNCLGDNGVPLTGGIAPAGQPMQKQPPPGTSIPQSALTACQSRMPLMPPEMDPKLNPNYSTDFSAWVNCINGKGLKVKAYGTPGSGNSGWSYDGQPTMPQAQQTQVIAACKTEAFRGNGH
ncbi:hypothetical protein [Streptomyces sp. CBMA123]|uniref:hypothetical protein n=1 Tax=Streptomyces sp. CBMA123 TaxID=1896313 RepID=UPI001661B5DE|nr:hypothetical protein [Streptomyces sp. CBMA123]MBD0693410.1 hypothetical protein [Streptomyces sp. CBMA123]